MGVSEGLLEDLIGIFQGKSSRSKSSYRWALNKIPVLSGELHQKKKNVIFFDGLRETACM